MEVNFTDKEIIFMYGHFKKKVYELEFLKSQPNCPVSKKNINYDINLYNSIAQKLSDANPKLLEMDAYLR